MSPANCPARMFVHIDKLTQHYVISKVILEHSHPCSADLAEMLPQHRELSIYDMPFASFVGVNHHGHSTLLGCALLRN
ncbi:hypothetical protein PIB30_062117 [Stylosanthes scabra]|uniref:Protein FAR1-RELATED SEQUENCE n=1 Tax=Stylosanthes scabra TaxID=79078 RepID=A0ABU6VJ91_9FABA|nr:hypothetical protein [Stylosanthes scabra]